MPSQLRPAATVVMPGTSRPVVIRQRVLAGVVVGAAVAGVMVSAAASYAVGDTWATKAAMPGSRSDLAAATGPDGKIYAIGGLNAGGGILATVEAYDPTNDTWATKAAMPTARNALAAATGQDGKIYAIGGLNAGGILATVEAYDPVT